MPTTINQKIQLQGGEEFRAGLKALGQVGQEAFKQVTGAINDTSSSALRLAPIIDVVQRKLKDIGTAAKDFGQKFGTAKNELKDAGRNLLELGAVGGGAVIAFGALIAKAGEFASGIEKSAEALGLTNEQLQTFGFAADQADVGMEGFQKALTRLNSKMAEHNKQQIVLKQQQRDLSDEYLKGKITVAEYMDQSQKLTKGSTQITDVFNRLGLSLYNANGSLKDGQTQIYNLADAFKSSDTQMKALILTELGFSKNKAMADFLNNGSEGLKKMQAEAKRLAPPLTDLQIKIGANLNDALGRTKMAFDSAWHSAALLFAPEMTKLADAVTEAIARNRSRIMELANTILNSLKPVVEDVIKLLNGEELSPDSMVEKVRVTVVKLAADVQQAIGIIVVAWGKFVSVLDYVAALINNIFGTEFSGQALAIIALIGSFTGVFTALAAVIGLAVSAFGVLSAILGGPLAVAIAAVGFAIGYFFGSKLRDDLAAIPAVFATVVTALQDGFNGTIENFKNVLGAGLDFMRDLWHSWADYVLGLIKSISDAIKNSVVGRMFGANSSDAGNNGPKFASGGQVRGQGTGTSDSIRAWLSDGEFVVRAKAVARYGAGLFHALNNMSIPSPAAAFGALAGGMDIPGRTHFASGGLVATALPAGGGGGRPVIIKIGEHSFGPFTGEDRTVGNLERHAASRQLRSTGRKPTWQGS